MTGSSPVATPVSLEANGFCLRPLRPEDVTERYVGMLNNPRVNRFLEVRWKPQTDDSVRAFVDSFYKDEEKYAWSITVRDSNLFIGTATLYEINRNHGTAELGLMIGDESYWGKGASETVLTLVINYALDVLNLRRIIGGSCEHNHGMHFTYKRLGFRREANFVKAWASGTGDYWDLYRWAILKDEWRARATR